MFIRLCLILLLFFVNCDFRDSTDGSYLGEPRQAMLRGVSIKLDQKTFEPGKIMKVYVSGLDKNTDYKVDRKYLSTKEIVGKPRYIKNVTSKQVVFRVLRQLGKYRIRVIDQNTGKVVARQNYITAKDTPPPVQVSLTLEKDVFKPREIIKVNITGLNPDIAYKVAKYYAESGDIEGVNRIIKDKTTATPVFNSPRLDGEYFIKLHDVATDKLLASKGFTVKDLVDPPIDPPVDPPVDPPGELHKVKFEILTDGYPGDNSWALIKDGTVVKQGPEGFTYEANKLYSTLMQVNNGTYYLEFYDSAGDGLKSPAYIKLFLDGEELYKGSRRFDDPNNHYKLMTLGKIATIKFRAGPDYRKPDAREQMYLDEHNRHRKIASEKAGLKHIPLRWSFTIEKEAQRWADYLVRNGTCNLVHESPSSMGENLAARTGNADPRPVDGVVQSWVNSEGHYSQLKWRGSRYMGCAEAYGDKCSVQACRFVTHGNCNGYDNWVEDYTWCTSQCPPEGCYTSK